MSKNEIIEFKEKDTFISWIDLHKFSDKILVFDKHVSLEQMLQELVQELVLEVVEEELEQQLEEVQMLQIFHHQNNHYHQCQYQVQLDEAFLMVPNHLQLLQEHMHFCLPFFLSSFSFFFFCYCQLIKEQVELKNWSNDEG
uniref:Uncharacterized protein n=1 Tax=Panagrolaimus sp. ES5 TaxID=591445 RepID=A0AC34F5X2_9BILA